MINTVLPTPAPPNSPENIEIEDTMTCRSEGHVTVLQYFHKNYSDV
jgi:hypothetical protein